MNFGDPSAIDKEMADRFVVSGANLPPLFKIGLMQIVELTKLFKKLEIYPKVAKMGWFEPINFES